MRNLWYYSSSVYLSVIGIISGEFAIEKLLDAHWGDENEVTLVMLVEV